MASFTESNVLPPRPRQASSTDGRAPTTAVAHRPRLSTSTLFGAGKEIEIQHGEAVYRLRITSLGKLILTK